MLLALVQNIHMGQLVVYDREPYSHVYEASYKIASPLRKLQVVAPHNVSQGNNDVGISVLSPIETGGSTGQSKVPTLEFDCSQLIQSEVVREVGSGKQKTTFEVVLPNGVHAAAKRCHSKSCIQHRSILREDYFFRNLFYQYGDESIQYYGVCSYSQDIKKRNETRDFTQGDTLFLELTQPIMPNWSIKTKKIRRRLRNSKFDIESLRVLARQYDGFAGGRLQLNGDDKYPHQYVRSAAGIRHADFDMMKVKPPDSPSVLEHNCQILIQYIAGFPKSSSRVNCTEAYSSEHAFE
jgi:hypothetical protein